MIKVYSFEDLTCWKKGRELRRKMYELAKSLPAYKQYNLSSQIRRAAVSVTANIAEGYGRYSYAEKVQFTRYSRASTLELQDHLYSCLDADYFNQAEFNSFYNKVSEVAKSINGYIGYIREQKTKGFLN